MNAPPLIYLAPESCQGDHQNGWQQSLERSEGLPGVGQLMARMEPAVFERDRAALLLKDDLLHPLRIRLDQKAGNRELPDFLRWKLKRFLPYPIEEVRLRFVPLQEPLTYLTFSLPGPWLDALDGAFKEKGVQCGYIGGLFATLIENQPAFHDSLCLCLYHDFYLLTALDAEGNYLHFQMRRLPYAANERLDTGTLLHSDLEPVLREKAGAHRLIAINFEPALDADFHELVERLRAVSLPVKAPVQRGSTLQRFQNLMHAKAVAP